MSIVEGPGSGEPPKDKPWLGWLLAVALIVVQFVIFAVIESGGDDRIQALASEAGATIWWADFNLLGMIGFIAPFLGLIAIPGAFGARVRQAVPSLPRHRWLVVAAAVAICGGCDVGQFMTSNKGGYATRSEVVFISGGQVAARHGWAETTHLIVACSMEGKRDNNPHFYYRPAFADGRGADLGDMVRSPETAAEKMEAWLGDVRTIDNTINDLPAARAADFFSGEVDENCVSAFNGALDGDVRRSFRRLFTHPGA